MSVLVLENVVKLFGKFTAVDKISFEVEPGTIFGILGPNGAGKTTTIRMITNILMPDEGKILLFDEPVNPVHQNRIGYLPEERGLYKKIKVIEQLIYFAQLKGMTRSASHKAANQWLRDLDAKDWGNKKIQELSKGMQQKVQFISTILHSPDLLVLDEPFSGFDPINVETLKKIISDQKEAGKTILLSTHVMEQVEQLCDNIILINKGTIILQGNVQKIKRNFGKDYVLMEFSGPDDFVNDLQNIKFINRTKNRVEFRLNKTNYTANQILQSAIDKGAEVIRFELVEPSLNEIFIDVVQKTGVENV
ncbi:MAG: ATP-binding cassette domain-containing protein [bacterium]